MTYAEAHAEASFAPRGDREEYGEPFDPARLVSADEIRRYRSSFPSFCDELLWINPKIKELVRQREGGDDSLPRGPLLRFHWNDAQREVWRVMCEQLSKGLPLRFAVLKARQVGISTFFCAYLFWLMWRQKHVRAAVCAYEKKTTLAEMRETMQTFYDMLPADARPALLQKHKGATLGQGDTNFADRHSRCKYVVQKKGAGRGIASDAVLCTEVSFYDEPDEFFGGFVPTMGQGSAALLVMESSPEDGYFKGKYEEYKGDGVYRRAVFIPWWFVRDLYSRELTRAGRKLFDKQTGREVNLGPALRRKQQQLSRAAAAIGRPAITDEQMWWWEHFCETEYDGDTEWMAQEFPDDDVTAFQRASRSAFKVALPMVAASCAERDEVYPDPPGAGTLVSTTYLDATSEQIVEFAPEHKTGWIDQEKRPGVFILEPPNPDHTYVVGADVADGEGEEDEEGERAFSTGCVYCCDTHEQVAWWRGHIDPTDWGDELVKLGYFYNTALLVVERNNMGRLTEHRIRGQLRYPRRFRWPDLNVGMTAFKGKQEMWETTATSKPMMISSLKLWLRDRLFIVRDPGLHFELSHYTVSHGKFEPRGAFADRIIAAALCVMGVEQTDYAYKNIVLGGNAVRQSAHGMAARILRSAKRPPVQTDELPEEFDALGVQKIDDVWDLLGV